MVVATWGLTTNIAAISYTGTHSPGHNACYHLTLSFDKILMRGHCADWFSAGLTRIITNARVFLPLFAASPPIVTSIASPIFVDLRPPSNTELIRHINRTG